VRELTAGRCSRLSLLHRLARGHVAERAAPPFAQFGNVLLAGKDQHRQENLGTLRVHAGGFGWKSKTTGDVIAVSKADLRGVEWAKAPPYACMLKLRLKGGFTHTFVGLRSQVRPKPGRRRSPNNRSHPANDSAAHVGVALLDLRSDAWTWFHHAWLFPAILTGQGAAQ
jgi:hypothetical protein